MGAESSKPASSSSEHVFTRSTPVRFSQQIVDSLETSADTDSSRAKDVELHIQHRVQQELQRLEAAQNQKLADLQDSLKAADTKTSDTPSAGTTLKDKISGATSAVAAKLGAGTPAKKELDRAGVQREIDALRTKLSQRKLKEEVVQDKQVEKAREAVVECLRLNDRRPLDCWKEVEAFQQEVGRLEGQFLGKVLE